MLEASTEFRKNGFNDQDAATLGTLAAQFQNVSDEAITAGDSASFIISQMIAFGVEADNASSIIDSVNEVANQFSVSSGDLSKALGNVASTAGAMGNSMEETLGMVTAITEQTRNASKASRSLNTIFSRLSQVADANSDTGKKLTDIYNGLGIALYDSEGQMRSSYDILTDLSKQWDNLSKNEQNYIALTSAGSNQLNAFLALMNNFGHATEATSTALNSAGSASRENAKYMESLEAKTQAVKATFQDLATNVISSDLVKSVLDLANGFLQLANSGIGQVVVQFGLLFGVLTGGSTIFANIGAKIVGMFTQMSQGISIIGNLSTAWSAAVAGAEGGIAGLAGAIAPFAAIVAGIVVAVGLAAKAIDYFTITAEEQQEKVNSLSNDLSSLRSEYEQLASSDNLSDVDQQRLTILEKEIELNEKLLAQEAQKAYSMTYGEDSVMQGKEIESDTERDIATEQYNNYTNAINEAEEALKKLQTQYDEVDASMPTGEVAIAQRKNKLQELTDAMVEQQSVVQKLREEQKAYDINDAGVIGADSTEKVTGLDRISKNIDSLKAMQQQISANKKEMANLDISTEAGANRFSELKDSTDKLESSFTELGTSTSNDIKSLQELGEQMGGLPDDAQAVVDMWVDMQTAQEEYAKSAEGLEERLRSIANVEIKPKDADSMGEWLQTLSETQFDQLADMLQLVSQNAEGLSAILSSMSGADAINYITEAYKEYYGTIDDATQATNEFNEALNTNFAEGIENQLTMIDYIQKSQSEGITNAKAYKAALEGVYGTSNKELIKLADNTAKLEENMQFNKLGSVMENYKSYFAEGVDGVSKFFKQLSDISQSTNEDLQGLVSMTGSIETGDLEVTIDDFGELADKLGLSETGLKSLIDYMQAYGDINIGESIDGTTANLQKLADGLDVVNDKFKTLIGSKDTDVFGGSLGTGEVKINLSTDEAKQKAEEFVNTVNEQTAEITGTQIEFDVNAEDAEAQLENVYNYVQNLQKYIDDSGNWDFSSVTDKLKDVNDITVDGSKIQIEGGEEAGEKLKQAILNGVNEDSAEGQTLLANFFNNVDVSGADDAAQKVVDALKNSINGKLNTTEIAVEGAFKTTADNMGLVVSSADSATDAVNKTGQAIDKANQKNLNGLKGSVDSTKGSVDNLNSSLSSVSTYVSKLQNKKINVTVNYTETNKPNTVGGTVKVPKAVGQIPAYANGKNLDGTTPMRMQSSGNALVGEEGAEFRITKDGKKELLGKYGAEIAHVDKGDTIIPADVTEMIRKGQLEGYAKGKSGSGKTSVSASLMAKPTGSFQLSDIKSKYDGKQIVSNNKLASSFGSTTKATSSNTKATNANTSAKSANADATDELTDAQKAQKEAFEEANDVTEHHIFLREKQGATYAELIKMSKAYQKQLNQQANWWRSQGFDDDSEEIRKIQKDWWGLQDDITSYQEKAFDERYQKSKDYIDDRNDLEDWGADSEIEAWHRVEKWMDEWYARGEISYKYYLEKRKEATKKAAEAEKKAWEEAKKAQIKELEEWQEVYEDLFDLVADKAQEEIDKLEEQRDTVEKYWDDKIDALEKANDELDDQIKKEEALDALARARSTKVMVYQNGRFQYINDMDEVSEAKTNLEKIEREQALKKEKENLEKQKEAALKAIDDQIEAWEKYKDEWGKVVSDYQKKQKQLNVLQKLGIDLEADNWKERLGNLQDYVNKYNEIMGQLLKAEKEEELGKDLPTISGSGASTGGAFGAGAGVIAGIGSGVAGGGLIGGVIGGAIGSVVGGLGGSSSSNKGSSSGSSSSGDYVSDKGYTIGSDKGKNFVNNAKPGTTMTGGDGSTWTKNNDGSTTIKDKYGTTHTVKGKRASGTKYAPRGIALTGEEGAELQVLNQGDGIIPHDLTSNLWEWGETKPSDIVSAFAGIQKDQSGVTICIENFNPSLPNVVDGEGFANYLKNNFWRNVVQYKTAMGRA